MDDFEKIATVEVPLCPLCGAKGTILYAALTDRLYEASGSWNLLRCSDRNCGMVWESPIPESSELWKLYVNYFTHEDFKPPISSLRTRFEGVRRSYLARKYGYSKVGASVVDNLLSRLMFFLPSRRALLDLQVYYMSSAVGGRLLEIGSGSGAMLKFLGELGWAAEGIETDPVAVQNARRKGLKVHQGDILTTDLPSNHFDVVAMSHVIEHLDKTADTLNAIHRILKPGGRLVIATPNMGSFGHALFKASWLQLDPPRHLRLFDPVNLRQLLLSSGFADANAFTTVRGASSIFVASLIIALRGRFTNKTVVFPRILIYRTMEVLDFVEWIAIQLFRDRGEELVAIATK